MTPEEMYQYIIDEQQGQPYPEGEAVLAQDPFYAYWYARDILKGPFPAGEPVIAQEADRAFWYARDVLKGPFPAGEAAMSYSWWYRTKYQDFLTSLEKKAAGNMTPKDMYEYVINTQGERYKPYPEGEAVLAQDPKYAYLYACEVLKAPFPAGEAAIARDVVYAFWYAVQILKNRFPAGEVVLAEDPAFARRYQNFLISQQKKAAGIMTPRDMYEYVMNERQGQPYPEGESLLAQDTVCAYLYAKRVLRGRFPAGEAAIAQNGQYAHDYARFVLNAPFPAGEAVIAENAWHAYEYARDVLKGPFPAGEAAMSQNRAWSESYEEFLASLSKNGQTS